MPSSASPSFFRPSEVSSSPNSKSINAVRNKKRVSNRRQSMATFMAIAIVLYIAGGPAKIAEYVYTFINTAVWTNRLSDVVLPTMTTTSFSLFVSKVTEVFTMKKKPKGKSESMLKTPSLASFDVIHFGTSRRNVQQQLPLGGTDILRCPSPSLDSVQFALRNSVTLVVVSNMEDLGRTSHLLSSLQEFVKSANSNQGDKYTSIKELIIICPTQEMVVFETLFLSLLLDANVRVLSEEALLVGEHTRSSLERSRSTESVLSLLVSRYVTTEFYLTLDKDLLLSNYLTFERRLLNENEIALFAPSSQGYQQSDIVWKEAERVLTAHNCIGSIDSALLMDLSTPTLLSRTVSAETVCRLYSLYGEGDQGWLHALYRAIETIRGGSDSNQRHPEVALYNIAGACPVTGQALFSKVHLLRS